MTIQRSNNKSKLSKGRQYVGNYYIRPRRFSSIVNRNSFNSTTVSCSDTHSKQENFRLSTNSFDTQISNEVTKLPLQMNFDTMLSVDSFDCNSNYAYAENKLMTPKKKISRGLRLLGGSSLKRSKQVPISMITFASNSTNRKMPLPKKRLSIESYVPKLNLRKSFDEMSELTSCTSTEEKERQFQIVDDTSTF